MLQISRFYDDQPKALEILAFEHKAQFAYNLSDYEDNLEILSKKLEEEMVKEFGKVQNISNKINNL